MHTTNFRIDENPTIISQPRTRFFLKKIFEKIILNFRIYSINKCTSKLIVKFNK